MSDTPLDNERLGEMLRANGASAACPSCSTRAWTTHAGPRVTGGAVPFGDGDESYFAEGLQVILMTCDACGFVRMHDLRKYRDALRGPEP